MRGTFVIDPTQCHYGEATTAVRQIVAEWMAIDWFAAASPSSADEAAALFKEHHEKARRHGPDLFVPDLEIEILHGGWSEFEYLYTKARTPARWDWKFSALKPLSHRHSETRGWSRQDAAAEIGSVVPGTGVMSFGAIEHGRGDIFLRLGGQVILNTLSPTLPLATELSKADAIRASWYTEYAVMDLVDCLEWQLADKSSDVTDNPFLPLLRCYGAGVYPFCFRQDEVVLFAFEDGRGGPRIGRGAS